MAHTTRKQMTPATRSFAGLVLAALVTSSALYGARAANAGTPEEQCQNGRYAAAAKYAACQQRALGKFFAGGGFTKYQAASDRCHTKYAAVWPKLQAKSPGSSCDTNRFTDNGATVTDNLTGLQWEKKTDDSTEHDKDNVYAWSAGVSAADGTAFTTFLTALNSGACFAGQCDWRLPRIYELQTIEEDAFPCIGGLCFDPMVFGPTDAGGYWSTTTVATVPGHAWEVFTTGSVTVDNKSIDAHVRAVRDGW